MQFFRFVAVAGLFVLFLAGRTNAQAVELFGGYSIVRAPVTFSETSVCAIPACPTATNTPKLNLNGWEVAGAFRVLGPLKLAADFSGTSGSFQGANTHLQTYLVGPQLRFPGPISPYAHFLVGVAHEAIGASASSLTSGPTQNAFASAVGGGLDLKVLPFISLRPIQIDYLLTHFNSTTQNQFRYSAGLVVHF
jgi:hypothetical protein